MVWFLAACADLPQDGETSFESPPPGPILAGGLAVDDEGFSWLSDPDRSRLVRVGPRGVPKAIALFEGTVPDRVAIAGNVVVVGLRGAGAAALVDRDDLGVRFVPVCAEPRGVDAAEDGTVWIACADGVLVHLDPAQGTVLATLPVEDDLRDVIDDGGETLWVSRFRTAEILRVDRTTGEVVTRLRPPTVDADTHPVSADVDPYTPSTAWRMRRRPDGGVALLHQLGATGALVGGSAGAPPAYYGGCNGIVVTTVTEVDPGGTIESSVLIDVPGTAIDLDVLADGTWALALLGSEDWGIPIAVQVIPTPSATACSQPEPIAWYDDLGWVQSGNFAHGTAIQSGPEGLAIAHTGPFGLNGTSVLVDKDAPIDPGWDLFHSATVSGASCAGCHPEGHEDGRTWRFVDEGVRRTQDIAGVSDTAPFHWGGELATLDDLMHEVHERRMGSTEPTGPSVTAALGAFLDRVPTHRAPPSSTPDLATTGAALFVSSSCDECHTDPVPSESQDVGTGGSFQVPRLAGVRYRVPLMHDGCAATIRERFDPACGGTDHNDAHLTEADIDALAAYLATL